MRRATCAKSMLVMLLAALCAVAALCLPAIAETDEASAMFGEAMSEDDLTATGSDGQDEVLATQESAATTPKIAITYAAPYGKGSPIQGQVFAEDGGTFDPTSYRISIFLQLEEGQTYWPKPTYDKPYADVGADGSFSAVFSTGENDPMAKVLHLLLIPSSVTPTSFGDTMAQAVDYVRIDRTEDGAVTVTPTREAPVSPDAAPAIDALLPVQEDRIAVDVGLYTDGSAPGSVLSEELISRQLTAVGRFSNIVRFYSASGEVRKAYAIAHNKGFDVVGTAYLCGDDAADKVELDALVELCNAGLVQVACVGNETLLETNTTQPVLTAAELVAHIQYVRARIEDDAIPVTTSDSIDVLLSNASVRNACNLIMPNCYPFWGGTGIDDAAASFAQSVEALQAVSGGKQVLVSETGWPTAGGALGNAAAGEEQAAAYFEAVRAWSLSTGTQVLYFQAADEPWKTEGGFGAHWGFMTSTFALKAPFAQTTFFSSLGLAAGCTHDVVADKAVAPTCSKTGLKEGSHCSLCGEVLAKQETIPATGHEWGAWQTVRAATEEKAGEQKRVCAHDASHTQTQPIPRLPSPVVALTHAPACGDASPFEGIVFREDGASFSVSNYAVTMYLEEPNSHSWWVKPTADQPYVTLAKDGTFSIPYTVSQTDANRTHLWILLLPTKVAKGLGAHLYANDFEALRNTALDCVEIQRTTAGAVSVSPQRTVSLALATVDALPSKTYTGSAIKPAPVVKVGARKLVLGTDYTVAYASNTNPGTASVTITGKGRYKGSVRRTFHIDKATQQVSAKASATTVAVGKTATVSLSGNKGAASFSSSDASVASVTSAGKVTAKKVGTVTIAAKAAATTTHKAASKTITIKVVPAATASLTATNVRDGVRLAWKAVSGAAGYKVYCGSTVAATVKGASSTSYTYAKAKTNGAKYAFKVVAYASTGTSTLSKSVTTYWLAGTSLTSLKSTQTKTATATWAKDAKAGGYTLQYGTSKDFLSGTKTVAIAKASATSKKLTGLAKGKTYYVRIRTHKTVGGITYTSAWSAAKSVKVA